MASMFTSQYPYSNCVVTDSFGKSHVTMAEFLKNKGYETYAIVGHTYVSRKFGFSRGFNYFDDNFIKWRNADEMTKRAVGLLKARKNNKKFFLWLHYREPHSPYRNTSKYIKMFSQEKLAYEKDEIGVYTINGKKLNLSKTEVSRLVTAYDGNIRFLDDNLKELFKYLEKSGLLLNSIIIITADHGESLGEHNIFDHNELYYGILRVPLIIKLPKLGRGINRYPVVSLDIFPTVVELLGYKNDRILRTFQGKSVFGKRRLQEELFSEYDNRHSLIIDNLRLFSNVNGRYEMYDINKDPLELNNLASVEGNEFSFLKLKMNNFPKSSKCKNVNIKSILDEETKSSLKSLGYIQ